MSLSAPAPIREILQKINQRPGTLGLVAYEGSVDRSISHLVEENKFSSLQELWVLIGSEGGFSKTEVQLFQDQGLEVFSLGDQVLRVETACISLVSVLKYCFGTLGPKPRSSGAK